MMKERSLGDDRGSMLPLTIFYGFLCIVLVLLVAFVQKLGDSFVRLTTPQARTRHRARAAV